MTVFALMMRTLAAATSVVLLCLPIMPSERSADVDRRAK